jgi:hypothetical protein
MARASFWAEMPSAARGQSRLGLMIQWWIDAIDSGAAHFDDGRWHRDFARFDADRARSGLL